MFISYIHSQVEEPTMSKYSKIADDLRKKIVDGIYKEGQLLPSQGDLTETYNTSRITIQKAIELLKYEGIVKSRQGYGTFVVSSASRLSIFDRRVDEYLGISKQLKGKGKLKSNILHFEIRFPTAVEQEKLNIKQFDPVYQIIRHRIFNDEPFLLEHTIMPVHVIPGIDETILKSSIYDYIEDELGLEIGIAERRIHADKPTEFDRKHLICTKLDPILEVDQVVFLEDGVPFEYSKTRYRYDKGDILMISRNRYKKTK